MPNVNEMREALISIRAFCRDYKGKHEQIFSELYQRTRFFEANEVGRDVEYEEYLSAQYFDAISTLLNLADRPSRVTLENTLNILAEISGVEHISDVQLVDENNEGRISMLSSLPAKPRPLSNLRREILREFRQHIPRSGWGVVSDDKDGRG
jgi:hypothetical protein